jgi:hypothetical protein
MTLKLFPFAKGELETLEANMKGIERRIVTSQHTFFVSSSGIQPFLTVLAEIEKHVLSLPPSYVDILL